MATALQSRLKCVSDFPGTRGGTLYDDCPESAQFPTARILRIVVGYRTVINSLEVLRTDAQVPRRGGAGANKSVFTLNHDEFITRVEGTVNPSITSLRFITNKGKDQTFGSSLGSVFCLDGTHGVPADKASQMGLLFFRIWADDTQIYGIEPTFAEYPVTTALLTKKVKYEKKHIPSDMEASSSADGIQVMTAFTRHLLSRVITLYVGPTRVMFLVHEDTLCHLPFFRAALKGGFKEATEGVITMPEDQPHLVSALIEFLSTGNYSYAYDPEFTSVQEEQSNVPIGDLDEGTFHVGVYAIAAKYECATLVVEARNNFREVLKEIEGVDVLKLWTVAYEEGLTLADNWGTGDGKEEFEQEVTTQLGALFTDHGDETEQTMANYPALSSDLLRLATFRLLEKD